MEGVRGFDKTGGGVPGWVKGGAGAAGRGSGKGWKESCSWRVYIRYETTDLTYETRSTSPPPPPPRPHIR